MKEKKVRLKMKVNNRNQRSLIGLCSGSYESTGIKKNSYIHQKYDKEKVLGLRRQF